MLILDANAHIRNMWNRPALQRHVERDKPRIVFIDREKQTRPRPDIYADNEEQPFRDHVFDEEFYDPPRWDQTVIWEQVPWDWRYEQPYQHGRLSGDLLAYGWADPMPKAGRSHSPPNLKKFDAEAQRTLKPGGRLYLKLMAYLYPPGSEVKRPNQKEILDGLTGFQTQEAVYDDFQTLKPKKETP
jgi:hypothetical protein